MGELAEFVPPVSVAYEGQALTLVGKLSDVALTLRDMLESVSPDDRPRFRKAIESLEEVISIMSAIDDTFGRIEHDAEKIIAGMADGEVSAFVDRGSAAFTVFGAILRRRRTLNVCEVAPVANGETNSPRVARDNLVVFKAHASFQRAARGQSSTKRRARKKSEPNANRRGFAAFKRSA